MAPRVFRSAAESGYITPEFCPLFKKTLTYCFYGRPAYRFDYDGAMRAGLWAPSVVIFEPTIEHYGVLLHPFDSGAFLSGRYRSWIPSQFDLRDFELPLRCGAPAKCVRAFYGSNENYWVGNALRSPLNCSGELEVAAVSDMISDLAGDPADDRRLAIEMVLGGRIPLNREYVRALVVPDQLKTADYVLRCQYEKNIPVFAYRVYPRKTIIEHQAYIEETVRKVQEVNGAI
ncbi:hypothetical protein [Paraburkholderia domus]|nr:hypothetical protein [Paraburkholderia domus]MBK5168926.1 hypothetical protein [Burkholderia sp. R-70211]